MSRSSKKGPYIDSKLQKKIVMMNASGQKRVIKTWSRSCTIYPDMISHTFGVHNGKKFVPVFVTDQMIGHKLGEFSPTRLFRSHGGKK